MLNKKGAGARVVVGMSGGVDSSVAAALLLEQGYEVIGVTIQLGQFEKEKANNAICGAIKAIEDARKVAQKLGIDHYIMDLRNRFAEKVVDYFTAEYLRGRTPNPCIACNRHIKFGAFYERARELGSGYIATGHYARIEYDKANDRFLLLRGIDLSKDQSYVLYSLTQEQLGHTLLPLGNYSKKEIREKAKLLGLEVADKEESQEICFIPDNDYKRFLEYRVEEGEIKPGPFINREGEVLGKHKGLPYYTVGQRKGLGLALGEPVYVVALDVAANSVIIGQEKDIYQKGLWAKENNFIIFGKIDVPLEVEAKIRYAATPAHGEIIEARGNRVKLLFREPQRAITPGQSVVYYQGDLVIGGGIIDEVI